VVATGSEAVMPSLPGLDAVPTWTSDEALTSADLPGHLAVLGAGAVGCELSQVYGRFGSRVTVLEPGDSALPGEPAWVGEMLCEALRGDGVDVRSGTAADRVEALAGGVLVWPSSRDPFEVDRVLVATGRRPRTAGLGLEALGLELDDGAPLDVDRRCRVRRGDGVLDDVFAIGDVTGVAPYTHTANYQARIVAGHVLGRHARDADYRAIPRAVYTDPAVFSVGLSADAAREAGLDVAVADSDVSETGRAFIEGEAAGRPPRAARLQLVADRSAGCLVGAVAVGPDADNWASELALAVHARVPLPALVDLVHAFPTWGEAILPAVRELAGY
jgi:dihydrolipoamide dehydrogenase